MPSFVQIITKYTLLLTKIARHTDGVASLLLRLILGPVLIASGWEKFTGNNYFGSMLDSFPFPFSVLPPEFVSQNPGQRRQHGSLSQQIASSVNTRYVYFGRIHL